MLIHAATACLATIAITSALTLLTGVEWAWIPGAVAYFLFVALEWRRMARAARVLLAIVAVLAVVLPLTGRASLEVLHEAMDRALYLGLFVIGMGWIQATAGSSPLIHDCGRFLLRQSPGRRYAVLTSGGALLGLLLSVGTVGLLGTMILRSVKDSARVSGARIAGVRLRRMTLAALRGQSSVPLWSPTSISMPIVLLGLPQLRMIDILPMGALLAVGFLGLGWVMDRISYRPTLRRPADAPADEVAAQDFTPAIRLTGLVACLIAAALSVAIPFQLSIISAILLIAPGIALVWQFAQDCGAGAARPVEAAMARTFRDRFPALRSLSSELVIFSTSAAAGVLILPLIDAEALGTLLRPWLPGAGAALAAAFVFVVVTSFAAVNPIVSVTLSIGLLTQLPDYALEPRVIAMTMLLAWGVALGGSPFTASVRLAARAVGQTPYTVGVRWNLAFVLLASILVIGGCLTLQ